MEASIRLKIEENLKPLYFECVNESYKHNVPKGSETHFKVCLAIVGPTYIYSIQF
jgi:BolA protein